MSRLRADIVVNKSSFGPFLAAEGMLLSNGKQISYDSLVDNTVLTGTSLTTTDVFSENITVSGLATFQGSINLSTSSGSTVINDTSLTTTNITSETLIVNQIDLGSNERIRVGDSQDLQIYHDGTDSRIIENSKLIIDANSLELHNNNSKKLETNSTGIAITGGVSSTDGWVGTTSVANVLGGIAMPFVCGINGRISLPPVNATMIFGGSEYSGDNTQGVVMPHSGKLVSATLHAENAIGNLALSASINGAQDTNYQLAFISPTQGNRTDIETWYDLPLSFNAGDRINFAVTTTTLIQMEVLSLTFFVKFD